MDASAIGNCSLIVVNLIILHSYIGISIDENATVVFKSRVVVNPVISDCRDAVGCHKNATAIEHPVRGIAIADVKPFHRHLYATGGNVD